jgi:beta-lactam-binding protein with PASTA domain
VTASTPPKPGRRPAPAARSAGWRARTRGVLPYLIVGGTGFVLAYLFVFLFIFPSRLIPDDRPVPNVVGLPTDDATRVLGDAGFNAVVGEQRVNASVPPMTVLDQRPAASAVKPKGTQVVLDVSLGDGR